MQIMPSEQWEMVQYVKALGGASIVGIISFLILNAMFGEKK